MMVAVFLFIFGQRINAFLVARTSASSGELSVLAPALVLFAVCVYGGFFNAGLGILLLAVFALSGMSDLNAMNGLKLWVSSLVALVAIARFGISDSIAWAEGSCGFCGHADRRLWRRSDRAAHSGCLCCARPSSCSG